VTTVLLWRKRYETEGLAELFTDRPRSGRPKRISDSKEAAIVEATIKTVPKDATHWSVRRMAISQKVSPATVLRIWKKHKLQPHRVDFTPTSSSWLNQVERWFAEITRKRIRRGAFRSVRDLTSAIHDYIRIYDNNPRPFQWVASASRIIRKVNRYRRASESI
jgi:transposase